MLFSGYDLIDWGKARLTDSVNFLRSIPSFFAPKPSSVSVPFIPPFTGGQCNTGYLVRVDFLIIASNTRNVPVLIASTVGKVTGATSYENVAGNSGIKVFADGTYYDYNQNSNFYRDFKVVSVTRADGSSVDCGDLPNPNGGKPIADDGLFTPNNPVIGDEDGTINPAAIILSPAAPIIAIGGGLALSAAAAAAAKAATDTLEAIKKVAEALDSLKKLWEKLKEFLEEWEKDRPKNRDIVRQTYGNIDGDGAIDFYPLSNKNFTAIQVDIVVTEIPIGFGKYFGSMSPSRYRYKELGYISFYSISQGIIETHSIRFKRSSLIIPKTAVGFIYHFGLDNKIKGFAFGTFSVRKS